MRGGLRSEDSEMGVVMIGSFLTTRMSSITASHNIYAFVVC